MNVIAFFMKNICVLSRICSCLLSCFLCYVVEQNNTFFWQRIFCNNLDSQAQEVGTSDSVIMPQRYWDFMKGLLASCYRCPFSVGSGIKFRVFAFAHEFCASSAHMLMELKEAMRNYCVLTMTLALHVGEADLCLNDSI